MAGLPAGRVQAPHRSPRTPGALPQPAGIQAPPRGRERVPRGPGPVQHGPRRVVRRWGRLREHAGLVHRGPDSPLPAEGRLLAEPAGGGRSGPGLPHPLPPLRRPPPLAARLPRRGAPRHRRRRGVRSPHHRHRDAARPPSLRRRRRRPPDDARRAGPDARPVRRLAVPPPVRARFRRRRLHRAPRAPPRRACGAAARWEAGVLHPGPPRGRRAGPAGGAGHRDPREDPGRGTGCPCVAGCRPSRCG